MTKSLFISFLMLLGIMTTTAEAQVKLGKSTNSLTTLGLPDDKEQFSKDFLDALTPDTDLGFGADVMEKLNGKNKSFVDDVVGILGSGASNNDMLEKIGLKKKEKDDFIQQLLGDSGAGKYYSSIKKKVEAFQNKYRIAKMFL